MFCQSLHRLLKSARCRLNSFLQPYKEYSDCKKPKFQRMKKFVVSAGLVAIGAASVQSLMADDANGIAATPKAWNVSASLRGFYDDNYSTAPNKKGSFGI